MDAALRHFGQGRVQGDRREKGIFLVQGGGVQLVDRGTSHVRLCIEGLKGKDYHWAAPRVRFGLVCLEGLSVEP